MHCSKQHINKVKEENIRKHYPLSTYWKLSSWHLLGGAGLRQQGHHVVQPCQQIRPQSCGVKNGPWIPWIFDYLKLSRYLHVFQSLFTSLEPLTVPPRLCVQDFCWKTVPLRIVMINGSEDSDLPSKSQQNMNKNSLADQCQTKSSVIKPQRKTRQLNSSWTPINWLWEILTSMWVSSCQRRNHLPPLPPKRLNQHLELHANPGALRKPNCGIFWTCWKFSRDHGRQGNCTPGHDK